MLSVDHEAPILVLREDPALVPTLLREALGIELPPFDHAEVGNADFTQVVPAEFRADLVVYLHGEEPGRAPLMAIVVEMQRQVAPAKHKSWPLYTAALHASADCPTCLLVIVDSEDVARWARKPILSLQPGSPFVPIVLHPAQLARVTDAHADDEPFLAILAALVRDDSRDLFAVARSGLRATVRLPDDRARFFYDLVLATLDDDARIHLESDMSLGQNPWRSVTFRRLHDEGVQEGLEQGLEQGKVESTRSLLRAAAERRLGELDDELRARIDACTDHARMEALVLDVAMAADRESAAHLLAQL